jgi:hypothetical protein
MKTKQTISDRVARATAACHLGSAASSAGITHIQHSVGPYPDGSVRAKDAEELQPKHPKKSAEPRPAADSAIAFRK